VRVSYKVTCCLKLL